MMTLYIEVNNTPLLCSFRSFFFFNDTATTEIYTLSLHDALPISAAVVEQPFQRQCRHQRFCVGDRKSTRLNSSHTVISYAVFCLKKKKKSGKEKGKHKDENRKRRNIDDERHK